MVARGHVQNGVIVLDHGVQLPEGQAVTIVVNEQISVQPVSGGPPRSVLDIPAVSLGSILRPLIPEDDLLGEMLDGRP